MISAGTVRWISIGVCAGGIAGMIVATVLNHNGAAITFGLVTVVAILCSMVATAVAADTRRTAPASAALGAEAEADQADRLGELLATRVEEQVNQLVQGGADEGSIRQLVGEAVRLGRTLGRSRP